MKTPLSQLSLLLISGLGIGIAIFSLGHAFEWFLNPHPLFTAIIGAISIAGMFVPRGFYNWSWKKFLSSNAFAIVEAATGILITLNAIGALGFYNHLYWYDLSLHVLVPASMTFMLNVVLGAYLHYRQKYRLLFLQIITGSSSLLLVILWELWEYLGDRAFGTAMFGQWNEFHDTLTDLLGGVVGILLVGIITRYTTHNKHALWTTPQH